MELKKEKQSISAGQLLTAIVNGDDINLSGCTIIGQLDINRLFDPAEKFQTEMLKISYDNGMKILTLPQRMTFDCCIFEESVAFTSAWSEPDTLAVAFSNNIIFNSSQFKSQVRFKNAVFKGEASFDGCHFAAVVTLKNAQIEKDAKFRTAVFNGYCLFSNTIFNASAKFTNSHFVKGVNFEGARFLDQIDFNGVYASSRSVPVYSSTYFARKRFGEDESFWRFVKQSAQDAGYYHLAGECFYREQCAGLWQKFRGPNYEALPPSKKFLRLLLSARLLPELAFGRFLFGYGEKPVRVLVTGAIIILLSAILYSQPDMLISRQGDLEPSFFQGLYFSTIIFTTLGYGDIYPSAQGFCRAVAMTEATMGAILMSLFVVCMAKRFSRG